MKKLVLMLLFVLGVVYVSNAQKVPTPDEVAKKNVEELEKRLKLTPTQKSVIYNFAYEFAKEQFALYKKQQAGTFKEEDETRFFKLQTEVNKNIKTVLKGDQIAEFDKVIEERLSGIDSPKKKKKLKKGEEEEKVVGIEGLKTKPTNN
jgi:protein CpxP